MSQPAPRHTNRQTELPIGQGAFIAVVGPSGVGKDTLLNRARMALIDDLRIVFVRRAITRPVDGQTENHRAVSASEFEAEDGSGGFAHSWQAHGLSYGVPVGIDEEVRAGRVAVCNGSRGALDGLRRRYRNFRIISLTARNDVLAGRLAARGRESENDILRRLARQPGSDTQMAGALEIANNGLPDEAGDALVEAIMDIAAGIAGNRR